jgi:hypothetical protein
MVVPALIPVTIPLVPTVPTAVFVLLHVPPATVLLNVVVDPAVTVFVPVVAGTDAGRTFSVLKALKLPQPVAVKVILAVPTDTPVAIPLDAPMLLTAVLEDVQV